MSVSVKRSHETLALILMRELARSFALGSVVNNGGAEGEEPIATGRARRRLGLQKAVVVRGPVVVPEGARSQPDRPAPEIGPHAVQSHRRQPTLPRDGKIPWFLSLSIFTCFCCHCVFGLCEKTAENRKEKRKKEVVDLTPGVDGRIGSLS